MNYLTTAQVAALLNVTPQTVSRLCKRGLVPGAIQVGVGKGSVWQVPAGAVEALKHRPPPGWTRGRPRKPPVTI